MQVGVLGALEVISESGEPVVVGALKRRVVLGLLAVEQGRVVSTERLIDAVWGDEPPASALATLQGLVYQLRQVLGAQAIESRAPGYALDSSIETDVGRVASIVETSSGSALDFDAALGLFRGRPLDDLADGAVVTSVRQHLVDLRLQILERWCTAALAEDRAREVVERVERELLASPWRESMWEQLMLALYRSNRQADALAAFGRARAVLLDDLGLEPGPALRALEQQILVHDPALDRVPNEPTPLPSGNVTFLLTDIVGSTRLWEQSPDAMDAALARQETIVKQAVSANGGVLLKARGEGDSTFSVFESAGAAVAAAVDAQLALIAEPWPQGAPLSVRMGIHTGEAIERNADYFGPTVNRAARLRAIATGSEILVSSVVAERCGVLPAEVTIDEFGTVQLRDVSEHVMVVRHPRLPKRLGPIPTASIHRVARPAAVTPFVGRPGELAHLHRRHARADGCGAVSMVMGEPGIGKTRLVAEVANGLAEHGYTVLWGRSPQGTWAAPYAPFAEALERHLASIEPDEARRLLGAVAAPLVQVLPIVNDLFVGVSPSEAADADRRRFEILDALSRLLEGISASGPVLLVLDDLHWVDEASSMALSFVLPLTNRAEIHILGTYRDTEVPDAHPLSVALAFAQREVRIDRVRLRGMSRPAGRELIQLGIPEASEATMDELMAASGGNPFFLGELVRLRAENSDIRIPDSVNDTIRQRLTRLGDGTNTLLRIGALFDERFPLDTARLVADLDEDAALDSIDEAIAAHLLEATDIVDEYRFVHALVRLAAQTTINPSRLPRFHRRIATTLEEQSAPGDMAVQARLAFHYHSSRALPGAERGIDAALAAADHAGDVAAYEERAKMLRIALELMSATDQRRPRVTAQLAIAMVRFDNVDSMAELAFAAGDLIAESEGGQAACDFFADLRSTWEESGGGGTTPAVLVAWAERGMEFAEQVPSDSYDYLYTTVVFGRLLAFGEDRYRERASLWVDEKMIAIGRRGLGGGTRWENVAAIAAAASHRDDLARLANTPSLHDHTKTGEYAITLETSSRDADWFRRQGLRGSLVRCHTNAARAAACLGDITAANEHLWAVADVVSGPIDPAYVQRTAVTVLVIYWMSDGPWDECKANLDTLSPSPAIEAAWAAGQQHVGWPSVTAIAVIMQARGGELDRALAGARSLVDFVEHADVHEYYYSLVAHACAEIAWLADDLELAERLEAPIRDRWLPCDFRHFACDVRLSLARLCAIGGRADEATEWFEAARAVFRDQGARPLLAITDHDEAWMHLRRPGHADPGVVRELLDRASEQFTEIGMTGWISRSAELQSSLDSAV